MVVKSLIWLTVAGQFLNNELMCLSDADGLSYEKPRQHRLPCISQARYRPLRLRAASELMVLEAGKGPE